jgi:MarR family transcriptional regulator, organic hydroperoxide resistance regulator
MTFDKCICFQLGRLSKKITQHYKEKISEFALTHSQFFMLMAVIALEGSLPSQLAEKTDSDRATTTGLIDRLERDDWLERRPFPEDRRAQSIHLSQKGKKNRKKLIAIFDEINGHFVNRFSLKEWNQFQHLLGKLE